MNRLSIYENETDEDTAKFLRSLRENEKLQLRGGPSNAPKAVKNAMDPDKLNTMCSRIICSSNITRQSLEQNLEVPNMMDDENFFENLKRKINSSSSKCQKENSMPKHTQNSCTLKRKKGIINDETENIIKRFKKNMEEKDFGQNRSSVTPVQFNNINNVTGKSDKFSDENFQAASTSAIVTNVFQKKSVFTPHNLNNNLKNPTNNVLLQMTSKICKDNCVLASSVNKTTIFEAEFEELLCYELRCVTPPSCDLTDEKEE